MRTDSNLIWYATSTIWVIIVLNLSFYSAFSLPFNSITYTNNPTYLDDYLYNCSLKSLPNKRHTGVLYNISLPADFFDTKVSFLRLRSSTLWPKGANFSSIDIPPKIMTLPHVKRIEIMYENLGNLSTRYFELPGYTLVSKVIGFAVYNASELSGGTTSPKRLNITLQGERIKVMFSQGDVLHQERNNSDVNKLRKCVRFDPLSGLAELADMPRPNVCLSQGVGHFAIAMPKGNGPDMLSPSPSPLLPSSRGGRSRRKRKKNMALRVWGVIGFTAGLIGLMLLVSCFSVGYKMFGWRKIQRMERRSAKSESLDTIWIGNSKFPFAPASRTQAVLEDDLAP